MTFPALLDHPPIAARLDDFATSYWLKAVLKNGAERDPVDLLNDLDAARELVGGYVAELLEQASSTTANSGAA